MVVEVSIQVALPEERYETNLYAHRKLAAELKRVDLRLQIWGGWAKDRYGELGYPTRAVTELADEGGLLARERAQPVMPEWPTEVATCDGQIAKLPIRHMAAVMATYFHLALPREQRIVVYARLSKYLARTRTRAVDLHLGRRRGDGIRGTGDDSYARDLDRARWTLKATLEL